MRRPLWITSCAVLAVALLAASPGDVILSLAPSKILITDISTTTTTKTTQECTTESDDDKDNKNKKDKDDKEVCHDVTTMESDTCATFINRSEKPAIDVEFATYKGSGFAFQRAAGSYAPGIPVDDVCGLTEPMKIFPTSVIYADGSSWYMIPPILGTAQNPDGAPLKIALMQTYVASHPPGVKNNPSADVHEECVSLADVSSKAVSHVQVVYRHLSATGASVQDDALDIYRNIQPGTNAAGNCRTFKAKVTPDVPVVADAVWAGDVTPDVSLLDPHGEPITLSAKITRVDFADGTEWRP